MNKDLFGDDNYDVQNNHNQLVRSDRQTLIVRRAEILLIDLSGLNTASTPFGPNQEFEIKVAHVDYIETPFWVKYKYLCLVPLLIFIILFVKYFI